LRKSTIIFLELGMLSGIIVAGYVLPARTPLSTFLVVSGIWLAAGNMLMIRKIRKIKTEKISTKGRAWDHIFLALAILAATWLLVFLFSRL